MSAQSGINQQGDVPASSLRGDPALLIRTVLYSLGNAAGLLTYNVFNTYITFFYADVIRLPAEWVGRSLFAFGFWNAINDPIAGWLSDRTRSRFGRRRFYIRALAIPVAIGFALVWLPPVTIEEHGATAVLIYFLIVISFYDMLQSIITLNQDALFPELYQDSRTRTSAATVRQIIGFAGGGLAVAMSPRIYSEYGWEALALLWGISSATLHLISLFGIQENPAYAQAEDNPSIPAQAALVVGNPIFRIVMGMNFVTRLILGVLTVTMPFYTEYVLKLDGKDTQSLLSALLVSATLSLLVWQLVFKWYGTRRTMMISLILTAICAIPMLFVRDLNTAISVLVVLGFVTGGTFLGPDLLFAELIDEDYVRTGVRREGAYRGVLGFVYRFPPAFANFILLEMLPQAGYDANIDPHLQPEAVSTVLRYFTVGGAGAAVLTGIALLYFYPLYGERLTNIQQQARQMRAAVQDASA